MRRSLLSLSVSLLAVLALSSCDEGEGETLSLDFVQQPIVGGQLETGYPAVGVVFSNGWGGGSMCTGTLITPKVVLTAAHCSGYGAPNAFFVGNDMDSYGQVYDVTNFIPHPNYSTVTENYAQISGLGKWFLSWLMLVGRLEMFSALVVFYPSFWRS